MASFFQIQSYLTYWLNAVDQHSLHSPFLFDLYTKVLNGPAVNQHGQLIESLRSKLLSNDMVIDAQDIGVPSRKLNGSTRKIRDIAETSLTPAKYSRLYNRLITHFSAKNILELGTSFGINTLYLADAPAATVHTFEGIPSVADTARTTFEFANAANITLHEGDINVILPTALQKLPKLDFAFIDATHTYESTVRYFDWLLKKIHTKSVIVVDDIHYSREMENAWKKIRSNALVYSSVDLYRCGILFFDPSLNKQHVVIQF